MTASIAEYDDAHLAEHYSWLSGGLSERMLESERAFVARGIEPEGTRRALDLGAGRGYQSIPLARLGFDVVAVDPSPKLLAELARDANGLAITTKKDDILRYLTSAEPGFELCVCVGDALTHLASFGDVYRVFREMRRILAPGGKVVLAFHEMGETLGGVDRFVPVHADETTIFTCFLEYAGDHVRVHDLVHRKIDGGWEIKKRVYRKLRLDGDWTKKRLADLGFAVEAEDAAPGTVSLVARL